MSERRLGNFNSCCRLCLSEKLGTLKSIFEDESRGQEIAKNIKTSLGVQIHSTDKLTTMICNTCSEQVNGWHSFRRGCIENQTTLIRRMNSFFQSNMGNITIQIKDEVVDPDERPIDVEDDDVVHVKAERIDETENLDASYDRGEILDDNSFELPPPLTPNMPDQLSHMNNDNENAMSDDQDDDDDEGMNMLVPFVEFSEGDTLLNGELGNHNSDDKTCTICGKHFSTPANRKKHERMVHLRKNKNFKTLKHILNVNLVQDQASTSGSATKKRRMINTHQLKKKDGPAHKIRKYCKNCYKKKIDGIIEKNKVKKVSTYCEDCNGKPHLCLECFASVHSKLM